MNDLISRQAAIDALKNRWKKTRNYEGIGDDIAEECELYLKQVPSARPEQQWIPCSERLPEKEGNYLITAQPTYNHAKDIRIAHWSSRWVGYVKSEIIAWMPLPEPYKEGQDG